MSKDVLRGHKKNLDVLRAETALKFIQNMWLEQVPSFCAPVIEPFGRSLHRMFARPFRRDTTNEDVMNAFIRDTNQAGRNTLFLFMFAPMKEAIQKTLDTCTTVEEAKSRLHYLFFKNTKTII
jgi:hypothetical protein